MTLKPIYPACFILCAAASLAAKDLAPEGVEVTVKLQPVQVLPQPVQVLPRPLPSATPPVLVSQGPRPEQLTLLGGDSFRGNFLSFDPKSGLRWQHPAIKQPLEVDPNTLSLVRLEREKPKGPAQRHTFAVKFVNDDELPGEVLEMDAERLVFKTWYAGTLTIPRKSVRVITPGQSSPTAVYEGPTGMEGWSGGNRNTVGRAIPLGIDFNPKGVAAEVVEAVEAVRILKREVIVNGVPVLQPPQPAAAGGSAAAGGWQFINDAFVNSISGATIGRNVNFPKQANIEFDLAWRGYLNMAIHLYTDKLDQYRGSAYVVNINQSTVFLNRHSPETGQAGLGNARSRLASPKSSAQISIRVDRERKFFAVLVDGALVGQWTDRDAFGGKGDGLMFLSQGSGATKISGIRVCEWDGRLPLANATGTAKLTEDYARLANNDGISGSFKGIKEGKACFATSFAPSLEIPLDRVGQIELVAPEKPAPAPGFVRATLKGRGLLTFKLESWTDTEVKVSSPNFGSATFRPEVFSQLEFNLDKPHTAASDPLGF
jgi:hypothetical protein